jgi:ATP-binding cassette, subfamily B, bacterial
MHSKSYRLMGRLIRENKWHFAGSLLFTVFTVAIEFIMPLLLAETLDYYLGGKPSTMPLFVNRWVDALGGPAYMAQNLWIVGLALVAVNLVNGVFSYFKGRWQSVAGENVALTLRETLYRHIQRLPYAYHVKAETGDLVQRCTSDVETVRRFLSVQLLAIANAVLMIAVALVVLLQKNVELTLYSMVMVPFLFTFAWLFFKLVIKSFLASDEAEGKMSAVLQENLTGVRVVRAFGQQQYEVEKFESASMDYRKKVFKLTKLIAVYWSSGDAMSMIQSMITLLLCIVFAIRGQITVGMLVIFTAYVGKLLWPVRQLGRILSDAGKSLVSLGRIGEVLDEKEEPDEPDALKPSLRGDIVFDRVSFGYEGARDVLKEISFIIKQGQTVAILGATGSGKSSVVHLLQRLFSPREGRITIGGTDIGRIDRGYLRGRIGLVLQEPFLYSKTIRENVAIAVRDARDVDIDRAVSDAAAKGFILKSEKGYDTLVGERGITLSGGQKQRLAIARTLLKENDVLIFDDSLSAVDTETDAQIRRALRQRSLDTTTIIISHRIVTLAQADLILVMENGAISQQGTHEELIRRDGLYKRIFAIQSAVEDELRQDA